jgi:hypothetical protein
MATRLRPRVFIFLAGLIALMITAPARAQNATLGVNVVNAYPLSIGEQDAMLSEMRICIARSMIPAGPCWCGR